MTAVALTAVGQRKDHLLSDCYVIGTLFDREKYSICSWSNLLARALVALGGVIAGKPKQHQVKVEQEASVPTPVDQRQRPFASVDFLIEKVLHGMKRPNGAPRRSMPSLEKFSVGKRCGSGVV